MANPASLYKGTAINTASPADLTLMLYNGAIKFCNLAIMGIEEKDIEKAHNNIVKAQNIIGELKLTLNFKYEISKDFDLVYNIILRKLLMANIHKSVDELNDALNEIREMRDIWIKVMKGGK